MLAPTLSLLALLQFAAAGRVLKRWDDLQVKHGWSEVPKGWTLYGDAPEQHSLDLRIGLKQNRLEQLVDSLYKVSDPAHESYGAHLSKSQVNALIAPHSETVSLVDQWLSYHGISTSAGDWLTLCLPIAQAEHMLGAKYKVYYNSDRDEHIVRTLEYSLPVALNSHIDMVAPTTYFGNMQTAKATSFLEPNHVPTIDVAFEKLVMQRPTARAESLLLLLSSLPAVAPRSYQPVFVC